MMANASWAFTRRPYRVRRVCSGCSHARWPTQADCRRDGQRRSCIESEDDLLRLLVPSVRKTTIDSDAREAAFLEDANGAGVVARRTGVQRTCRLDPRQKLLQRASGDPLAPVLPADPVRHLALTLEVETRDVTHHSALALDDPVRVVLVASDPCPPCIEGTAVVGIGGGKGRHPNRLTIRPVLEQHIQIPILELAKDNVWRPVPHDRRP